MKIRVKFMRRNALLGVFWRRKWFVTKDMERRHHIGPHREVFIFLVPCLATVLSWRLRA